MVKFLVSLELKYRWLRFLINRSVGLLEVCLFLISPSKKNIKSIIKQIKNHSFIHHTTLR